MRCLVCLGSYIQWFLTTRQSTMHYYLYKNHHLQHSNTLVRSVSAAVGLLNLDSAGREAEASLVAGGVVDTSGNPDTPGTVDAVGAGDEAGAVESQVAGLIDLPAGGLGVTGSGLSAGDVSELALTWWKLAIDLSGLDLRRIITYPYRIGRRRASGEGCR